MQYLALIALLAAVSCASDVTPPQSDDVVDDVPSTPTTRPALGDPPRLYDEAPVTPPSMPVTAHPSEPSEPSEPSSTPAEPSEPSEPAQPSEPSTPAEPEPAEPEPSTTPAEPPPPVLCRISAGQTYAGQTIGCDAESRRVFPYLIVRWSRGASDVGCDRAETDPCVKGDACRIDDARGYPSQTGVCQ